MPVIIFITSHSSTLFEAIVLHCSLLFREIKRYTTIRLFSFLLPAYSKMFLDSTFNDYLINYHFFKWTHFKYILPETQCLPLLYKTYSLIYTSPLATILLVELLLLLYLHIEQDRLHSIHVCLTLYCLQICRSDTCSFHVAVIPLLQHRWLAALSVLWLL